MAYPYSHLTCEKRKILSKHITDTFSGVIPVLVRTEDKRRIQNKKYLLDETETLSRLLNTIRRENNISNRESLLSYCDNNYISPGYTFHELYSRYIANDGFLYLTIIIEDAFG